MTNAEKFKKEQIEELEAKIRCLQNSSIDGLCYYIRIYLGWCKYCIEKNEDYCSHKCREGVEEYLEQEVQDEN